MRKAGFLLAAVVFSLALVSCGGDKSVRVVEKTYADGKDLLVVYYSDNKEHVKLKEEKYHPDGKLLWQGEFKNNERDGYWRSWYPNGNIWSEGAYIEGKNDGEWKVYFENGRLRYVGSYANGIKTGEWVFYDENGRKQKVEKY